MSSPPEATFTRRRFLTSSVLAGTSGLALVACGGSTPIGTSSGPDSPLDGDSPLDRDSTEPAFLQAAFPAGNRQPTILATGSPQRAIFGLTRGTGYLQSADVPAELPLMLTSPSGATSQIVLPRRNEQIPRHYYPLVFTPTEPGAYSLTGEFEGEALDVGFKVAEPSEIELVQLGEQMRALDTPTFNDARGVDPICTRAPDLCPFHEVTLTDALASGSPVALMISTPGFCQTGICGPTLEIMIAEAQAFPDITFVHAEVYTDPQQLGELPPSELIAPVVSAYAMSFEPAMIVANASGAVTARVDVTMDAFDIREALATATA